MKANGHPKLASVIIPTYNRAGMIGDALRSVVAQDYRPLEIIVIDDGSSDDTAAVVHNFAREIETSHDDLQMRYIAQPNAGVGAARNHGLIEANGQYIQFLDSDDVLHPNKLRMHIDCLSLHPDCDYAFSDMGDFDNDALPHNWDVVPPKEQVLPSVACYANSEILTMVGVYRRSLCNRIGPWAEDIQLGEDEHYSLRVLSATDYIVYLPGDLCAHRHHRRGRLSDPIRNREAARSAVDLCNRLVGAVRPYHRENQPAFVSRMEKSYTDAIIDCLAVGESASARLGIYQCSRLRISIARRARLILFGFFALLPRDCFNSFWKGWLGLRKLLSKWV